MEQKALTDSRFGRLGLMLVNEAYSEITMDTAQCLGIGRMVKLWNECQERHSYTLSDDDLVVLLGHRNAAQILIDSGLGEREKRGIVRIKGTTGRIEWLANARNNGPKGGEHGSKGGRPRKTPQGVSEEPQGGLGEEGITKPPPAPAPALPPAPAPTKEPVQGSELAAGLRALGIAVPKSKVAVVGRWAERFGGAERVLALAREHIDRIEGANYPLQYLGGILRKDADGTGPRLAHGGSNAAAQPARKLTQDFPHPDSKDPELRKKYGLPPLQGGSAGGPDGAVH